MEGFSFLQLLTFGNILAVVAGSLLGMMIGAMPGLGATVGCALVAPFTFTMDPVPATLILISLYMSAMYGGSISAIVLGVPGTPAAVATLLDGNPMAKAGFPGKALGYSLYSSTIGGFFGVFILTTMTGPLAKIAINLSDPELFLIGILGLLSIASLGVKDVYKCLQAVLLGLFIGTVGMDLFTSSYRFTFGNIYLADGISLIALVGGLFALAEVLELVMDDMGKRYVTDTKDLRCHVELKEFLKLKWTILKSSIIGTVFGIVPGLGASPATWFAYTQAKRESQDPDSFGKGNPHGIAAAESANNACVGGALVPMLSLGIPGSSTVAVIMSALIVHGIQPGPHLFESAPKLVYGVYWGLFAGTICMFIFGHFTTTLWARMLVCPNYVLIPIILITMMIGNYSARYFTIDVWMGLAAGAIIFFLKRIDFPLSAFTLSFVLAKLIEDRFRRSLMLSKGSLSIFFTRPFCLVIWALIILMIYISIKQSRKNRARAAEQLAAWNMLKEEENE